MLVVLYSAFHPFARLSSGQFANRALAPLMIPHACGRVHSNSHWREKQG